ncbi:unnamed protein product [Cuscuta epithymum]|uniref:Uncharacterized protein n=1 Tax=Cuscuta epithymum TaxID=186058 RepID=A0AAV0EF91_9ASTE|nr:unnamed protein product [Cuscuta epithymum]
MTQEGEKVQIDLEMAKDPRETLSDSFSNCFAHSLNKIWIMWDPRITRRILWNKLTLFRDSIGAKSWMNTRVKVFLTKLIWMNSMSLVFQKVCLSLISRAPPIPGWGIE